MRCRAVNARRATPDPDPVVVVFSRHRLVFLVPFCEEEVVTEAGMTDMLSFKMACNLLIADKISNPDHIETGETDMISFMAACNPPRNMVAEIYGSGGPCGGDSRMEQA